MKQYLYDMKNYRKEEESPLRALIDAAEGRARVRTLTPTAIYDALQTVEYRLNYIPKAAMEDVRVEIDVNAQHFPGSYRGIPESTWFTAVYKRGSWRITDIYRATTSAPTRGMRVHLTDKAKAAVLAACAEW